MHFLESLAKLLGLLGIFVLTVAIVSAQEVELSRFRARCARLDSFDGLEVEHAFVEEILLCRSLHDFHQEVAAFTKVLLAELNNHLVQIDSLHVIDETVTDEVRYSVRNDDVSFLMAKKLRDCLLDLILLDVSLSEKHAICRLHLKQVDGYHRLVTLLRVNSISGDLRPTTRSCTNVNDLHSRSE